MTKIMMRGSSTLFLRFGPSWKCHFGLLLYQIKMIPFWILLLAPPIQDQPLCFFNVCFGKTVIVCQIGAAVFLICLSSVMSHTAACWALSENKEGKHVNHLLMHGRFSANSKNCLSWVTTFSIPGKPVKNPWHEEAPPHWLLLFSLQTLLCGTFIAPDFCGLFWLLKKGAMQHWKEQQQQQQ